MNLRTVGHPENLKRVSGNAWFRPSGETGWINLGNVVMHQCAADVQTRSIKRATRHGIVTRSAERVIGASYAWTIRLNEHVLETLEILMLGERGSDVIQAAGSVEDMEIADVQPRRSYDLGKLNVSAVTVTVDGYARTAGLDYLVDAEAGLITVLETGVIAAGDTLAVSFDFAPLDQFAVDSLTTPQRNGTLRVMEFDGEERGARRATIEFACSLTPSRPGEDAVAAFSDYELTAAAIGPVKIVHRAAPAAPELLVNEHGEYIATENGEALLVA